ANAGIARRRVAAPLVVGPASGVAAARDDGTALSMDSEDAADVTRRIAAFEKTHDPAALWPGLSEADRVAAARALERVTREILGGRDSACIDDRLDPYALAVAGH